MKAISFENVSKLYNLGVVGTGMFTNDVYRWFKTAILRQEDPYFKLGETNDRSKYGSSKLVWALKDISFDIEQGDVVGIIGKNGAGKSTLLKLLSQVTGPTTGKIKTNGRIASLLEVGTGFHPELTGRENIYMNGAILGMTKQEINSKLDEIIDFSGCERYIDTPVKRYSSGMMVRLGFAVAAHLEPEILVVDEVLAVGDAEFQKKAIGKMQDVSKGQGRTVLFVSHNMTSIRSLCKHGLLLDKGSVVDFGDVGQIVSRYLRGSSKLDNHRMLAKSEIYKEGFELIEIGVRRAGGSFNDGMSVENEIEVVIRYNLEKRIEDFWITMHLKNDKGEKVFSFSGAEQIDKNHGLGKYEQICIIPPGFLNWGTYAIDFMAFKRNGSLVNLADAHDIVSFTLMQRPLEIGSWMGREPGDVTPRFVFSETRIDG